MGSVIIDNEVIKGLFHNNYNNDDNDDDDQHNVTDNSNK